MTLPRLSAEQPVLRDIRCVCGNLLARGNIEKGIIEIVCRHCKTKVITQR